MNKIIYPNVTSEEIIKTMKDVQAELNEKYGKEFEDLYAPAIKFVNRTFLVFQITSVFMVASTLALFARLVFTMLYANGDFLLIDKILCCSLCASILAIVVSGAMFSKAECDDKKIKPIETYLDDHIIREMVGHRIFVPAHLFIKDALKKDESVTPLDYIFCKKSFLCLNEHVSDDAFGLYYPHMDLLHNIETIKAYDEMRRCKANVTYGLELKDVEDGDHQKVKVAVIADGSIVKTFPLGKFSQKLIDKMCKDPDVLDLSFLDKTAVSKEFVDDKEAYEDFLDAFNELKANVSKRNR